MTTDVKTNEVIISSESSFDRQTLYDKALELGRIFSHESAVAKMGIYGSLARGIKSPADIDLLIFVRDPALVKRIMMIRTDETRDKPIIKDPEGYLEEALFSRLSEPGRFTLIRTLLEKVPDNGKIRQYPVDYFLLPYPVTNQYIAIESKANKDPKFLASIASDVLIYSPNKDAFVKETVFTPQQTGYINTLAQSRS